MKITGALGAFFLACLSFSAGALELEPLWLNQGVPCNWGLAAAPDDSLYCVEAWTPAIAKFDSDGNLLFTWGEPGTGSIELYGPGGIAVDSNGKVYVADSGANRIVRFAPSGEFERLWGNDVVSGSGELSAFEVCSAGQICHPGVPALQGATQAAGFTFPHDVAIDPRDNSVIVADSVANRVVRLNPITNELTEIYDRWDEYFPQILSAEVDENGSLYVTVLPNEVAKLDWVDGVYVKAWKHIFPEQYPPTTHYLALDSRNNVYVSNESENKINAFSTDGEFLIAWGWGVATGNNQFEVCTEWPCNPGTSYDHGDPDNLGQFGGPIGIAVDSFDRVIVTDNFGRLQQFGSVSPAAAIVDLIAHVITLNLSRGITNSLDAKLSTALNALQDMNQNNDGAAANKIEAFINEVEAQRHSMISDSDADVLITKARAIIDAINSR